MSNGMFFILWWFVFAGLNECFWYVRGRFWASQYSESDRALHDICALIMFFLMWFFAIKP